MSKKPIFRSYWEGITDLRYGESYSKIIEYFLPELVTALMLYSLPILADAYFIACLKSTDMYAALQVTNTMIHALIKIGESFSVGTIVLTGLYNGRQKYKEAGRVLSDSFWTTLFFGLLVCLPLYFGATTIYEAYGVTPRLVELGAPFLRLQAISIFFVYLFFAFAGFLRGIKNTKVPMQIFVVGSVIFLLLDYVLIFGKFGFPTMGLMGSAVSRIVQYAAMSLIALIYTICSPVLRKYSINMFVRPRVREVLRLCNLTWPVTVDKATIAGAYVWLGRMLAPMGTFAIATFGVVKDMERTAILPAVAFAQIATLLASNAYAAGQWKSIKSSTKKITLLSCLMVFVLLLFLSIYPRPVVALFDKSGDFTAFASTVFPILSVLIFFDLLQLTLAGALRGSANMKTVMVTRAAVVGLFFIPASYFLSSLALSDPVLKFVVVYGTFYVGNALMSLFYILRFRGNAWKEQS